MNDITCTLLRLGFVTHIHLIDRIVFETLTHCIGHYVPHLQRNGPGMVLLSCTTLIHGSYAHMLLGRYLYEVLDTYTTT